MFKERNCLQTLRPTEGMNSPCYIYLSPNGICVQFGIQFLNLRSVSLNDKTCFLLRVDLLSFQNQCGNCQIQVLGNESDVLVDYRTLQSSVFRAARS